ncbi:methyl-accepting chemotaxis protein (MCP) signaling protein [Orenia metallireducens]|jgi:methyl-accepting chemotaxis protein|uniref:Methyl-accepting chemotaxis protein (MCP) signalling domain-containing protein n=1 Tax=Orenia metallireducens TaxID=1413210 RepID=A0A285GBT0_9FIRM|nr:methyl-accepting chemotaxis protein [Orenia metallireducens]PRX32509.1 methyl-accepting chemotaxis protein (MCP) signaling protein [Orenia metallireducens]SNY21040.1 Methyl-accepting chemotaxis protein (MCP) signalling domain-containing protein [Orenia metallireducens]
MKGNELISDLIRKIKLGIKSKINLLVILVFISPLLSQFLDKLLGNYINIEYVLHLLEAITFLLIISFITGRNRVVLLRVSEAMEDLTAHSEELSALSEEGNASIKTTSELIDSITASIKQVSASTDEVSAATQQANDNAYVGEEKITQTLRNMININKSVEKAVKVIGQLNGTSKEIGGIVQTVENIADQINLLALNASIEAARAGDYGKGFAVVAEEIRQLAKETNRSTQNISSLITDVQGQSKTCSNAIEEVENQAKEGHEITKEVADVFFNLEESSSKAAKQTQEIATATKDLADHSEEMRAAAQDIQNMSDEVTLSSQNLAAIAQEFSNLIDSIQI